MLSSALVLSVVLLGQPPQAATCRLTPLHTGVCKLDADHVLGKGHSAEERLPFVIYAFLVEGPGGKKALIDLGPRSLEYTNTMFRRYGFFRDLGPEAPPEKRYPDDVVQPHGNVFAHLKRRGIAPAEIDHIIFTHLHADHHGMDNGRNGGAAEDFKNAVLHVSRKGWDDNLKRRSDGKWNSYVDHAFGDFLLRREKEGKVRFEDDAEIFPGLRTVYLGGHSVCSQGVVVETEQGRAIIASDDVYRYDLLEKAVMPAIRTSPENLLKAVNRLVELSKENDGVLLPLHEPRIWEAYEKAGKDWLTELRPVSSRAVRAYVERRIRR